MAESVLSFVLEKLGDAFVKEVLQLNGVSEQVDRVSRELIRLQAFLKDADRKRIVDERQEEWVQEVRDIAYSIEDVIDTIISESEVTEEKSGTVEAGKRWLTGIKKLPTIHRLGNEINKIEERIQEIETTRVRYSITNLGEVTEGERRLPVRPIALPNVDETGIVGFEADRDNIVSLLLDETTRNSVVSIVGIGGLGKTTLARKVYNSEAIKKQFYIRIWVTISKNFDLIDILQRIAEQFGIVPPKNLNDDGPLNGLSISLQGGKYLIVLDNVWENNQWNQIEEVIPDENWRSILITTRFADVDQENGPISVSYKPQFLTKERSLELLMRKALCPNQDDIEGYLDDLYNIGEELAKRCGGLPLALELLGGLLSRKLANCVSWRKVMETIDWGTTEGENCFSIIRTSYGDLSFALKSCFMYFAAFPEDYEIDAQSLLRMWIAEGFISQQENKIQEDTAEILLEDLAQRNLIRVSERAYDGSIKRCRIHDLLHDFAITKAREENFLVAFSKVDDEIKYSQTRRMAIYDRRSTREQSFGELAASSIPNLRSIFYYGQDPNISQLMRLKVLSDLRDDEESSKYEPRKFGGQSQLRYVQLTMMVYDEDKKYFEKFISGMRFLHTLDLEKMYNCELPDNVWKIKTLKHVLLPEGTLGPPSSTDLTNLQTLSGVTPRRSWEAEGSPKLPNVKYLKIYLPEAQGLVQFNVIIPLLDTMKHLITLCLYGPEVPLEIIDMRRFSFYHCLQNLELSKYSAEEKHLNQIALDVGMLPKYLITLTLVGFPFRKDPIPALEKLENLRYLSLEGSCVELLEMRCSTGGFRLLEELILWNLLKLEEWKIEEGAMPMLKKLEVRNCEGLRVPLGLQYLTVLQGLLWWEPRAYVTKQNEILSIRKHVPFVKFHRGALVLD